jgi:hypothetical protein
MRFNLPVQLYDDQVQCLNEATEGQRMEFEELAAYLEYECGLWRGEAERRAYSKIQWKYRWGKQIYPDHKMGSELTAGSEGRSGVRG